MAEVNAVGGGAAEIFAPITGEPAAPAGATGAPGAAGEPTTFDALVEQAVATLAVASAIAPQQPMPLADVATEGGAPATAGLPALLPAVEPGLAQLTWAGPRAQPAPASGLDPLALATQAPSATATPAMALPVQVPPSAADGDAVVPAQPQPSSTPAAATGSSPDTAPAQATPRPADAAAPSAPPRPLAPQDALVVSPQPAGATAAGPVSEPSPAAATVEPTPQPAVPAPGARTADRPELPKNDAAVARQPAARAVPDAPVDQPTATAAPDAQGDQPTAAETAPRTAVKPSDEPARLVTPAAAPRATQSAAVPSGVAAEAIVEATVAAAARAAVAPASAARDVAATVPADAPPVAEVAAPSADQTPSRPGGEEHAEQRSPRQGQPSAVDAPASAPSAARAEAPPPAETAPAARTPVFEQVVRAIQMTHGERRSELLLRLDPPSLGELHVRLTVQNDHVTVHLRTASGEVKGLLESSLAQLRQALADQGLRVEGLQVSLGQGGGLAFGAGGEAPWQGAAPRGRGTGDWPAEPEATPAVREPQRLSDHVVDYRV